MRTSRTVRPAGSRRILMIVLTLALTLGCAVWQGAAGPAVRARPATSVPPHLLLILGERYPEPAG